jgi:hypothetical protein
LADNCYDSTNSLVTSRINPKGDLNPNAKKYRGDHVFVDEARRPIAVLMNEFLDASTQVRCSICADTALNTSDRNASSRQLADLETVSP